jgi:hypothetical protein
MNTSVVHEPLKFLKHNNARLTTKELISIEVTCFGQPVYVYLHITCHFPRSVNRQNFHQVDPRKTNLENDHMYQIYSDECQKQGTAQKVP